MTGSPRSRRSRSGVPRGTPGLPRPNPKRTDVAGYALRQPSAAERVQSEANSENPPDRTSGQHVEFVLRWLSPWLPPRERTRQPVGSNGPDPAGISVCTAK